MRKMRLRELSWRLHGQLEESSQVGLEDQGPRAQLRLFLTTSNLKKSGCSPQGPLSSGGHSVPCSLLTILGGCTERLCCWLYCTFCTKIWTSGLTGCCQFQGTVSSMARMWSCFLRWETVEILKSWHPPKTFWSQRPFLASESSL